MRTFLIATTALVATASAACADTPVDEIVVTAARLPTAPDLITGARVIDRAEIEARGVAFAGDLLSTIPGVAIARQGGFGGLAAIRIRGASPDKTLVLIDGMPVGDAAEPNGSYDPSTLQLADVERLEVLSGPHGSLWGSEAVGGVIAITTREIDGWRAEAEAGSLETFRGFAGAGLAKDSYELGASLAAYRSSGVSKADLGTEKDGFKILTANLGGRYTLSDTVRLSGRLRYTRSKAEIDGYAPPAFQLGDLPDRYKNRAWQGDVRASVDALGLNHEISFGVYDLHRTNLSSFPSSFEADRQVLRWTARRGETLVFGAEHQQSSADLSSGAGLDLSNTAVFAVGRAEAGPLTFTASARHDDPEAFRGKTTGRLAIAARLGGGFTATASVGTGFKTPSISQAVCDFCFTPPVPLRPEEAEGYDLRFGWTGVRISAAVTGYRLRVKDQISYSAGRYINIARTGSSGLEAELNAEITDAWSVKLAYARLDAIDRTTLRSLIRVPDHSGAAALFWTEGPWRGALTARAESSQTDTARDGFSRVRRPGFVTADASLAYEVSANATLTARIENLADRGYQETFGYREAGRTIQIGVRFKD